MTPVALSACRMPTLALELWMMPVTSAPTRTCLLYTSKLRSMEEKISYRLFLMGFLGLIFTAVL